MPVAFQSLQDTSGLPQNVLEVVRLLARPLPKALKSESAPCTPRPSSITTNQLQKVSSDLCTSPPGGPGDKVLNVLDTVLLTSAGIEQLIHIDDDLGERPTKPLWHTMLRAVAKAGYKDAITMTDVRFVRPKNAEQEEGEASMLVALIADASMIAPEVVVEDREADAALGSKRACPCLESRVESPPESGVGDEDEYEEEEEEEEGEDYDDDDDARKPYDETKDHPIFSSEPVFRRPYYDDAAAFFGLNVPGDANNAPSEEEAAWLDLPLDAHILAGRRSWPSVVLPVLCVAECDNIVSLVASTAYQRRTWGLDMPAVGLQLSKFGSVLYVFIAWVDPADDIVPVPTVHVLGPAEDADAESCLTLASQGFFDLAAPDSALLLAQFIASLVGSQFETLQKELLLRRPGTLKWRCDSDDSATWTETVEDWAHAVGVNANDDVSRGRNA